MVVVVVQDQYYKPNFAGRGGGQVVSVRAFYSNDPSSIPHKAFLQFFCKFCVWKNKQKEAEFTHFLDIKMNQTIQGVVLNNIALLFCRKTY